MKLDFAAAIPVLESYLTESRCPFVPGAIEMAQEAIRGSAFEEKWRGPSGEFPDQKKLIRRAIERLSGRAWSVKGHPTPRLRPSLGVGWGTYKWLGGYEVLGAALEGGAVLIDTAATYRYGKTEKLLGDSGLLDNRGRTWIATKFARNHAAPQSIRNSLERSLRNLRLEWVDLLQVHWPFFEVPIAETMGALQDLKEEGLIGSIGVCNMSVDQIHVARLYAEVSTVQVHLTAGYPRDLLQQYCSDEGLQLIAHSPFDQGKSFTSPSWFTSREIIPIPGTNDLKHLRENLHAS